MDCISTIKSFIPDFKSEINPNGLFYLSYDSQIPSNYVTIPTMPSSYMEKMSEPHNSSK